MCAGVHPSVIKAISAAMLKNNNLMVPVATILLNYVEKDSNRVKIEKDLSRTSGKMRELSSLPRYSDPSDDDCILSKGKKNPRVRRDMNSKKGLVP